MWKWAGWICVGLGAIGAAVPIMPTVPFLLMAAFCFERGSPELHRRLLEHKTFGPPLRAWRNERVIGVRAKVFSVASISASVTYVLIFRDVPVSVKAVLTAICLGVVIFILCQKSRSDLGRD